jgi:uncharacterized protein
MFNPQSINHTASASVDAGLRAYFLKVYNYMASALILTGLVAYFAGTSPAIQLMQGADGRPSILAYALMFAPLGAVMFLSIRINHMSEQAAQLAFWGFSVLMGLSMFYVFAIFTGESIARVFFITAGTFGAMSLYGYTTKRDLTGFGSFLMMGVFGIVIASIVNIFLGSAPLQMAISVIGVLLFTGLTAYDTQRIKNVYYQVAGYGDSLGKAAIMGALSLYLDFINLFVMLLQFMGDRR